LSDPDAARLDVSRIALCRGALNSTSSDLPKKKECARAREREREKEREGEAKEGKRKEDE